MTSEDDWTEERSVPVPRSIGTLGMVLFLAALFMLFMAVIAAYLLVRLVNPTHPPLHSLHLPNLLWVSTALVICVSICLHFALSSVRRERQRAYRFWIAAALALGIAFVLVQIPALTELLLEHYRQISQQHEQISKKNLGMYGLIFCFILLHALHVVGGIAWLSPVTYFSFHDRYDHEHYLPVRHVAMYWHFLDVVWIAMFLTFFFTQ